MKTWSIHIRQLENLFIFLNSFYKLKNIYVNMGYIHLFGFPTICTVHWDANLPTHCISHVTKFIVPILMFLKWKWTILYCSPSWKIYCISFMWEVLLSICLSQAVFLFFRFHDFHSFLTIPQCQSLSSSLNVVKSIFNLLASVLANPSQCHLYQ